jgi:hypothetical protein
MMLAGTSKYSSLLKEPHRKLPIASVQRSLNGTFGLRESSITQRLRLSSMASPTPGRWCVQSKNLRPKGHLGTFFTLGLAWCLVVALMASSWQIVSAYFLAYLLLRLTLAWVLGVWGLQDDLVRRNLWLVPVRDLVNLCVYAASFMTNTIEWRDSHFRVLGPKMVSLTHHGSFK